MANTIKLAHSHVSGEEPDTLDAGEVAINTNNQKIWVGNGSGNTLIFNHASYASSGHSHSVGDGGFTQKNFTSTLKSKLDGIATGATNTAAPYYTSAIAVGDGGLTQKNFTTTLKSKLDGIQAGANNYSLPPAGNGTRGGVKLGYTESGQFYPVEAHGTSEKLYVNVPWQNTTYVVQDGGLTENNFTDADHSKLNGIQAGATNTAAPYYTSAIAVGDGGLTQKNFTTTLKSKLDGIATGATNTAAPFYTSAIAVGDGGLTQKNFTTTLKSKLDGIASGATNTAAPFYTSAIAVGDGGLTQKNFTTTLKSKLDGIAAGANNYSFPYTVSASASNSTVVQRHSSGYIYANYFNGSGTWSTSGNSSGMALFTGSNGSDNFGRAYTAAAARALLNVADGATNTAAPYYTSAIAVGDGGLTQKNFTSTLKTKLDGIAAGATNTSAPYYTSAIAVGDGGLTQKNFTTALKNKLDGIAAGATNTTDTWRPVEAGGNTLAGNETLEFKAGSGISISESGGEVTLTCTVTDTNTTYSVGDNGLTQKNFTTTLKNKLDGIATGATNTAAPYYTSAISVGDGGLTQKNFTTALKSKLDGIASGANNYSFPYTVSSSAGNSTVVQRTGSGYIFANYFNTSPNTITTNIITKLVAESGDDGYMRHADASSVRAFLNVANGATNTAAPYYTSAIAVGDGGLTQKNFTSTLKTKLDGIATGATANTGTVTAVSGANGLTGTVTGAGTISLNLSALPDMTQSWTNGSDEFIVLDGGTQKKKLSSEIFGNNAFNSTAIPTNTNQLTNGANFASLSEVDDAIEAYGGSMNNLTGSTGLFGGGASGVTNKGISQDIGFKLMNGTMSVGCVTTSGGTTNEYLRYGSGGTFTWDTIQFSHLQNLSALTALP